MNSEKKCPICNDVFYTEITDEIDFYNGNFLCLNCMTVFNEKEKVIELG